jgi:hypothetical protein
VRKRDNALHGNLGRRHFAGQNLKRERQQRIAGQNRRGFSEFLVTRRLAAPHVVVVHCRQVVVNQRVCVNHFDRTGRRQRSISRGPARFRGKHHEHRPQTLSRRQQTMTNGFSQRCRASRREPCVLIQARFDEGSLVSE